MGEWQRWSIRVGAWSLVLLALDAVPASALSHPLDSTPDNSDTVGTNATVDEIIAGGALDGRGQEPDLIQFDKPVAIAQANTVRADAGQVQTTLLEPVQVEQTPDVPPPAAPRRNRSAQQVETAQFQDAPIPGNDLPDSDLPGSDIESLPTSGEAADLQGELLTPQPFFGQLDPDAIFAPIQLDSVAPFPGVPFLTEEEPNFVFAPFRTEFSPLERPQYRLFNFETGSTLRQRELVLRAGMLLGLSSGDCDDGDVSCGMRVGVDYGIRDDLLFSFDLALQEGATIPGIVGGNSEASFSFNSISAQIKWQAFSNERVSFAPTLGLLVGPQRSIVFSPADTDTRVEADDTSVVVGLALPVSITLGEVNRFTINPQVSFFPGSLSDTDVSGDPNDLIGRNGFDGDSLEYYGTVVGIGLGFDRSFSQYFKFAANYTFIVAGDNALDNGDDSLFVPRGVWDAGFRWTPNSRTSLDLYLTNRFSNTASPANILAVADGDIGVGLDFSFLPDIGNDYPIEIRNRYPATYHFLSSATGFPATTLPIQSILYETVFGNPGRVAGTVRYGLLDDLELVALGSSNGTDQFRSEAGLLFRYALLRDLGDGDATTALTFGVQNLFGDPDVAFYTDVPTAFPLFDDRFLLTVSPKGAVPIQGDAFDAIAGVSTGINWTIIDRTQLWGQWTPVFGDNLLDDGSSDEFADLDGNRHLFTVGVRQLFPSGNSTYALDFFFSNTAGEYGVQGLTGLPAGDTRLGARVSILNGVPWQTRQAEGEEDAAIAEAEAEAAAAEDAAAAEAAGEEDTEVAAASDGRSFEFESGDAEATEPESDEPELAQPEAVSPEESDSGEPDSDEVAAEEAAAPKPAEEPEEPVAEDPSEPAPAPVVSDEVAEPEAEPEAELLEPEAEPEPAIDPEPAESAEPADDLEPIPDDATAAEAESEPTAEADEPVDESGSTELEAEADEPEIVEPVPPLLDPLAVDSEDSEPSADSEIVEEDTEAEAAEQPAPARETSPELSPELADIPDEPPAEELPEAEAESDVAATEAADTEPADRDAVDGEPEVVGAAPSVPAPPPNSNPSLVNDTGSTLEDTPLAFGPTDLLANDTDPDGDTLTIASVQDANNGEVVLNEDGSVAFTPNADVSGRGSFSYTVSDGNGGFNTATVDIELAPVNDAPVGDDDTGTTPEDTPLSLASADLLSNDSDLDGDTLTIASVQDASNGTATLNQDGSVAFTPNANFSGLGSFSYTVDDGNGSTAIARVTVDVTPVNDAPVGTPDFGATDQGTALTFNAADLLANDSDLDGDTLTIASVQEASNGTVTLNADNTVTYTPTADFNGDASFTYTVDDGNGSTANVAVTVTVNAVAPPAAPPPEAPAPEAPAAPSEAEPDTAPGYVPPSTSADDLLAPIPEAPNPDPSNNGEGN